MIVMYTASGFWIDAAWFILHQNIATRLISDLAWVSASALSRYLKIPLPEKHGK